MLNEDLLNNEQSESFQKYFNQFPFSESPNVIGSRYKILIHENIKELSNNFGNAYKVEDIKTDDNDEHYAFVYEPSFVPRLDLIAFLKDHSNNFHIRPIVAEVVHINEQKYCLCVVMKKPFGKSLKQYIKENGSISEGFIMETILPAIIKVLSVYETNDLSHGLINADNIYIDDRDIIVGDCVREPCGFSQPAAYETLERVNITPIGKGSTDVYTDYFSLGVLLIYLLRGNFRSDSSSESDMIFDRMVEGSFDTYAGELSGATSSFKTLVKGLVIDRKHERWTTNKIIEWLKGKKFSAGSVKVYKKAYRFFSVGDNKHYNIGTLANNLWKDWEAAKKIFKDFKIVKWIENSVGNPELADRLSYTVKIGTSNSMFISIDDNELVARALAIIDPDGGIRYKDIALNIEGVPAALQYAFAKKSMEYTTYLRHILDGSIISAANEGRVQQGRGLSTTIMMHFDKCKSFLKRNEVGFGLERVLYELNPMLTCQSPVVIDYFCFNVYRLMTVLNEIMAERDLQVVDRHIASFISNKIGLKKEVRISSLSKFPEIESNRVLRSLAILAVAQKESDAPKLINMTKKFVGYTQGLISFIRSKTLRTDMTKKLENVAESGVLDEILAVICDPVILTKDQKGFEIAQKRYIELEYLIQNSGNSKKVYDIGYNYGLRMTMIISYSVCLLIIITLLGRLVFQS